MVLQPFALGDRPSLITGRAIRGKGILPVKAFVEELKRQNFDGLITIEYENYESDSLDDIRQSLEFLKSCSE